MIKRIFYYIVSSLYVFFSSALMPIFFLIAFNYSKGSQNNEDGITFIPLGFILIIITVFIDVLLVRKALKMNVNSRRNKLFVFAVLIIILTASFMLSFSTWEAFFECLEHYKGLNLGLQK